MAWLVASLKLVPTPTWYWFPWYHKLWMNDILYNCNGYKYWHLKEAAVCNAYLEDYIGGLNGNVENFDVILVAIDTLTSKEKINRFTLQFSKPLSSRTQKRKQSSWIVLKIPWKLQLQGKQSPYWTAGQEPQLSSIEVGNQPKSNYCILFIWWFC